MAENPYDSIALKDDNPYAHIALPAAQEAPPSTMQKIGGIAADLGKGLGKSAIGLMSTGDEWARQHLPAFLTNTKMGFGPPADLEHIREMATPQGTAQTIGKGIGDAAQFFIPGGAEEKAIQYASAVPKIGRAAEGIARIAAPAISAGLVNKAQGGSFGAGAALGGGGAAAGQALRSVAPALAETAMHVRGNQRLFGRTVGDAILKDTSGIRPSTVAKTAGDTIKSLEPEINAADAASAVRGERGSLAPARETVANKIRGYEGNRAMKTAEEIKPVQRFLATDQLTNLPLAENQTAAGLRSIKRGINSDFIGKWGPEESVERKQAARSAYGDINRELHRISPETAPLDQRISSLIPVKSQADRVAVEAPFVQRFIGRIARPTGGLLSAVSTGALGAGAGYKEGGTPGAIAGGALGLVAPELIASPEGELAIARSFNRARALKPLVGTAAQFTHKEDEQ